MKLKLYKTTKSAQKKQRMRRLISCELCETLASFAVKKGLFFMLTLSFFSCGEWGWQKVDYDFESQLNVFGMIMLGDELESYVVVQQSIDLQGSDMTIIGYDTIYYGPDSSMDVAIRVIGKSTYMVEDATVYITDGIDTAYFFMLPLEVEDWNYYRISEAKYTDTLGIFIPQPNATYTLHVSTPDGRVVTGELTTPDLPYIHSSQVPDTVYNKHQYTVPFRPIYDEDIYLRIRTRSKPGFWGCGMNQITFIDYGDTTWTSTVENCSDDWWSDESNGDSIRIELQAIDQNYYDYFIKNSESAEFINFVMGDEGNTAKGFGLEGGMGVFGAIAIDAVDRVYIP